jgi:hypothetical protein
MTTEKTEELLLQMADAMSVKEYYKLKFQFTTTDYITTLPIPIDLNPKRNYVIYMKRFSVFNTIFNVDTTKNIFTYYNGAQWKTITIPPGAYEIKQLNTTIQSQMQINGDWNATDKSYYISIVADEPTSKSIMTITNNYQVNFTVANSINSMLGFTSQIYSSGVNISQNIIQITLTNDIDIHCSLVTSNSYINGERKPILYSISAYSIQVGAKIIVSEINPIFLPLNTKRIDTIRFQIKDDNDNLLNFNGETIVIDCVIQQV